MEAINDVNELLTTKLCSPVIVYGVVAVVSLISIYLCRQRLNRYNTVKMENLHNLFTMQELKFLIVLGVIMFGLCQYNKTELAWIFLIFPIIYSLIQNGILYIHVSSAIQNAPQEQPQMAAQHYGLGMNAPLLSQGPPKSELSKQPATSVPSIPTVTSGGFEYSKPSNGMGEPMNSGPSGFSF
jgi:hypothetical protein|tara:strand:- start:3127 stop:3675 length:549 start_codon:yes stop_codon:yes gene_type:complete